MGAELALLFSHIEMHIDLVNSMLCCLLSHSFPAFLLSWSLEDIEAKAQFVGESTLMHEYDLTGLGISRGK
jgi:hypothetical protein